jgi:hypothetical protein
MTGKYKDVKKKKKKKKKKAHLTTPFINHKDQELTRVAKSSRKDYCRGF